LYQNIPNPFNPTTRIDFDLEKSDRVEVVVYDVAGRRVATLFSGQLGIGPHSVRWDGRTASGKLAASGVYWYELRTSQGKLSRSMVLMK